MYPVTESILEQGSLIAEVARDASLESECGGLQL